MKKKRRKTCTLAMNLLQKCNLKLLLQSCSVLKTNVGSTGYRRVSESVPIPGNSKQNPGSAEAGVGDDPGVRGTVGGRSQHFGTHVRKQAVPGTSREKHVD